MAVGFGGATRYEASFGAITAYPISLFVVARNSSTTVEAYPLQYSLTPGGSDRNMTLGFRGDVVSDPVEIRRGNAASTTTVARAGTFLANTYINIGGSSASTTVYACYANGVKVSGAATVTTFPAAASPVVLLGAFVDVNTYSAFLNGGAFRAAIWNAALTDDEMISLARGFSPRRIRPQSLKFYAPLIRTVQDLIGAIAFTATNAVAAVDSPRAYGQ